MRQIVNANSSYLIHLVDCSLADTIPEELPPNVTWKEIYKLAKHHSIDNLIFYSVEKTLRRPLYRMQRILRRKYKSTVKS